VQMRPELSDDISLDMENLSGFKVNKIGVAVSGGGDSLALLYLVNEWAKNHSAVVCVVTVDHGLRAEAKDEANKVKKTCSRLGVSHAILNWTNWNRKGNLQSVSRNARYALISEWALSNNVDVVALGHTQDDIIETFLMRLARGSGVDGLSQMSVRFTRGEVEYIRPILKVSRDSLRQYLRSLSVSWTEDPSNSDERFHRVRLRKSIDLLNHLGVNKDGILTVSRNMREARQALEFYSFKAVKECIKFSQADIIFIRSMFITYPREIQRRVVSRVLEYMADLEYPPRASEVENLIYSLENNIAHTLGGFHFYGVADDIRMSREFQLTEKKVSAVNEIWDNRWRVTGRNDPGLEIRALGNTGLKVFTTWKDSKIPRIALISSPAVWNDNKVVAALFLDGNGLWKLKPVKSKKDFISYIQGH